MTSKYNFRAICDLTENVLNLEKGRKTRAENLARKINIVLYIETLIIKFIKHIKT